MANVKVKLLTARVDGHESWVVGDIIEVSASEAKALIEGEYAEPVAASKAKRASKASSGDAETR